MKKRIVKTLFKKFNTEPQFQEQSNTKDNADIRVHPSIQIIDYGKQAKLLKR
ncbi:hypothetical protein [Neobacillus sp. OS1-33]|uniref:hypothetical protein n=1 Tax=Neobacillus sp. OS1-33 TaxID=3070683 RepID=UPI0027E19775|nr:hypothetical protein [Neobacillus sp. OS1-33]WML28306.1 hypothetical protein RCG22_12235 [Neobacillus sp. OS1-33]